MAQDKDYQSFMENLQEELNVILLGRERVVQDNWEYLRQIAKKGMAR